LLAFRLNFVQTPIEVHTLKALIRNRLAQTIVYKSIMAALCSRCGHYILQLWFLSPSSLWPPDGREGRPLYFCLVVFLLSSSFFFFFFAYSQPSQIERLPYFHTWCGLSANLGCRSETCCTWLVENTGCKKSPKIRQLRTTAQLCRAISLQLRHVSAIRKNLLNSNTSPTCHHNMVNFSTLAAEIGSLVWGTPANFHRFCILASLLQ